MAGPRVRRSFLFGLAVLAASVCASTVSAQTGCESSLARAQALYISGAFDDVEEILEPCVQPGRLSEDNRVWAYRLLALSALQQGRLVEAKLVTLSLLNLRPDYQPDPVLDPPSYADLIHTVRSQLAVARVEEPAEADTSRIRPHPVEPGPIPVLADRPPGPIRIQGRPGRVYPTSPALPYVRVEMGSPARGRRSAPFELSYWSGVASFTGDFYRTFDVDEYLTSDGPRLGMQAAYTPASWLVVGMGVEGGYHSKFPAQRGVDDQPGIRTEALVGMATVDARVRAWSQSLVSPYMSTGVSVIAARMLEEMRYGVGPGVSVGLDLAPTRGLSIFTEASAIFPLPEDAIDNSSRRHGDVFSGFRLGLRSRIGR